MAQYLGFGYTRDSLNAQRSHVKEAIEELTNAGFTVERPMVKRMVRKRRNSKSRELREFPAISGMIFCRVDGELPPRNMQFCKPYSINGHDLWVTQEEMDIFNDACERASYKPPLVHTFQAGDQVYCDHPVLGRIEGKIISIKKSIEEAEVDDISGKFPFKIKLSLAFLSKVNYEEETNQLA